MQNDIFGNDLFGNGELPIAFLIAVYGAIIFFSLVLQLVICFLIYNAAKSIPPPFQQATPGQAFLLMIPLFNLVWIFLYTKNLAMSFRATLATTGSTDDCGEQLGMWWGICSLCALIPCVGFIAGFAALVLLIMYLLKIHECKNRILQAGAAASPYGDKFGPR